MAVGRSSEFDTLTPWHRRHILRTAGCLRLKVPVAAVRLILPSIVPPFLAEYPDIRVEVTAQESLVDILAQRFDAGSRPFRPRVSTHLCSRV